MNAITLTLIANYLLVGHFVSLIAWHRGEFASLVTVHRMGVKSTLRYDQLTSLHEEWMALTILWPLALPVLAFKKVIEWITG